MALQECSVCGDMFNYGAKTDICPQCQMELADEDLDLDDLEDEDE